MPVHKSPSFLAENNFQINKLKKQKSREILQYQHNNSEISIDDDLSSEASNCNESYVENKHFNSKSIGKNCFPKHDDHIYLEPLKGKQKRPKFLLDFKVLGLNNIPLFNNDMNTENKFGVCYIKWSILDHNHDHLFGSNKTSKNNVVYLRDYEALKFFVGSEELKHNKESLSGNDYNSGSFENKFSTMSRDDIEDAASSLLPKTEHMHPSATNPGMFKVIAHNSSKGSTKRHKIIENRCDFNYQLDSPVILKLNIDEDLVKDPTRRHGNRSKISRKLSDEFMVIECFYELLQSKNSDSKHKKPDYRKHTLGNLDTANSNSTNSSNTNDSISISSVDSTVTGSDAGNSSTAHHKVITRIKLGEVKINLTEYIHESENWQTNYFLLQNSKVNSALKFTCHLKLVRGSYDEFDLPKQYTSGQLPGTLPRLYQNKEEIKNNFQKRRYSESVANSTFDSNSSTPFVDDSVLQEDELKLMSNFKNNETFESVSRISEPRVSLNENRDGSPNAHIPHTQPNLLKSSLLTTMKHKNFVNNFLRNPYEYDDPRDCVKDILDGKSGWNIDAIFTKSTNPSKNISHNTHEMGRLLDKYGSTQKISSVKKLPKNSHSSFSSRIKTTGGWYVNNSLKQNDSQDDVSDYHIYDIWEEFDDSDIEQDEEITMPNKKRFSQIT